MIFYVITVAIVLRLIYINQSLWLDEAINVLAARDLGFWQYVTGYSIGDFHPPGFFVILWIWTHIFGFSELSVRAPSIIFGVLTVLVTYLLGKEMFSKRVGFFGSLFLAFGPLHIYYSQEARMYSMAALAATISCYFLYKALNDHKKYWWFYSLSLIFVIYSDYLAYLIIFVHFAYIFIHERKRIKEFLKFFGIGCLGIFPWLFIFPEQFSNGRITAENVPGWRKVVGGSSFKSLLLVGIKSIIGRIRLSDSLPVYSAMMSFIGFVYVLVISWGLRLRKKEKMFLVLWLILPIFLAFLVSFFVPVLSYFRMIFVLPAFYLLLAVGLDGIKKQTIQKLVVIFILGVSFLSLFIFYTNSKYQREDWKGLVYYLRTHAENSLVIFEDSNLPAPFRYYSQDSNFKSMGGLSNFPANELSDVKNIEYKVEKVYLVDYLVEISDPKRMIDKKLTGLGYEVVAVKDIPSLGLIYEYSK